MSDLRDKLKRHASYEAFLKYERSQQTQEQLRTQLKAPLGRDPPLHLSVPQPPWKSSRPQALSPVSPHHSGLHKTSTLAFSSAYWERVKSLGGHEVRPQRSPHKRKSTGPSQPSFVAEVSPAYQFTVPASDSIEEFNPFLRPQGGNRFFPATYFFLDDVDYASLEWPKKGWSRWREVDERWQWRECVIVGFEEQFQRFSIVWKDSNVQKYVSRVNLRFEGEPENEYLAKAAEATHRRDLQEATFRVESRVEAALTRFPTIVLESDVLQRVLESVQKWLNPLKESQIVSELQAFYRKSVVNFIFEVEHFASKWQLTVTYCSHRPWLLDLDRHRVHLDLSPRTNKAVTVARAWLENRTFKKGLLQEYLKKVRSLRGLDLYEFLKTRAWVADSNELSEKYREEWAGRAKTALQVSEEMASDLYMRFSKLPYFTSSTRL